MRPPRSLAPPAAHYAAARRWQERANVRCLSQEPGGEGAESATPASSPPEPQCTAAVGLVMAAQANFVRIKVDHLEGSDAPPPQPRLLCVVRALLKKMKREVLVGDRVRIVGIDWTDGRGMVDDVLPRTTSLAEPPVANVNHVLLVFSLSLPPLQPSAATRYLVAAEAAGLPITVALNKTDLLTPEEVDAARARIESWGYCAVAVSVAEERGMEELEAALRGRVTVLAGPSGAGKSSIINAMKLRYAGEDNSGALAGSHASGREAPPSPEAAENTPAAAGSSDGGLGGVELQAVGSVSERIGRGKHTTRNVMLMEIGGGDAGGFVVDTPGFNQPSVSVPPAQLAAHFPEVAAATEAAGPCAFSNCQHIAEPDCVVRAAGWERYGLYAELHAELKGVEEESNKRAMPKREREGTARMKSRPGGRIGVEARLESKSHRRVSRRSVKQSLSELVRDVEDDDSLVPPS